MKTKSIRNIFVLALVFATIMGCSRFEDGPKVSFRSMIKRICGTYRIDYVAKNGNNLTDYWNQYYNLSYKFSLSQASETDNILFVQISGEIDSVGSWKNYYNSNYAFIDKNDLVTLHMYNCVIDTADFPHERMFFPLVQSSDDYWRMKYTIIRLSNNEMWLFYEEGYDEYEIHFKKN